MKEKIQDIKEKISAITFKTKEDIEHFRVHMLGRKGEITSIFKEFKNLSVDEKKRLGKLINDLKSKVLKKISQAKNTVERSEPSIQYNDLTKTASPVNLGCRHPLSQIKEQIISIFSRIGYIVIEDREIEDDWHVFSALNFPEEHPAKDMQDTFFLQHNPDILLRTHTSSVQVRVMEKTSLPIRTINPGRVFRNEAISSRAHCIFHQVEGLYIDIDVSFADLKQNLYYFSKEMFGKKTNIRFRPSFFPFTEPSAEMDISCTLCNGKGCHVCKHTGWLEILGCGMVDPQVLKNNKIDPDKYTGFAFGMGIERITMLKYKIADIRMFFENDIRFLRQFISG